MTVLDPRGQLLRAAVGFATCSMLSNHRALWALPTWLDSWPGIGHVAVELDAAGRCGDLHSAVEGDRVWMTWTCGAAINRAAADE